MRDGNLELGDPFRDLRETIKIIFVRAIKDNLLIHQVSNGSSCHALQQSS